MLVYDPDLVRKVCRELSPENDPEKIEELVSLLRSIIEGHQVDLSTRLRHLAYQYQFLEKPKQ
jgi:hypothetical protein